MKKLWKKWQSLTPNEQLGVLIVIDLVVVAILLWRFIAIAFTHQ